MHAAGDGDGTDKKEADNKRPRIAGIVYMRYHSSFRFLLPLKLSTFATGTVHLLAHCPASNKQQRVGTIEMGSGISLYETEYCLFVR
jgi:hypothetical protein